MFIDISNHLIYILDVYRGDASLASLHVDAYMELNYISSHQTQLPPSATPLGQAYRRLWSRSVSEVQMYGDNRAGSV